MADIGYLRQGLLPALTEVIADVPPAFLPAPAY